MKSITMVTSPVVGPGLGVGALDLVGVAVDEYDPATVVLRVAAVGLVEDLADDLGSPRRAD
jgi:hypothetical protein